ncbi:6953_t:CDS:2, partial [Gigaspora rosea]
LLLCDLNIHVNILCGTAHDKCVESVNAQNIGIFDEPKTGCIHDVLNQELDILKIFCMPSETTKPITSKTSVNNPPNEITIFTQAVTEVYPGYETTITTSSDGVLMTYVTYYPPRTAVVLKPVTSSVPAGDSIVGT